MFRPVGRLERNSPVSLGPDDTLGQQRVVAVDTVRKWRGPFAGRGLAGLADLPRVGRPRRISELTRAAVVALACQLPAATGVPLSRWTGPELLAEVTRAAPDDKLAASPVLRILAEHPSTRSSRGSTSPGSPPCAPSVTRLEID
jgi:Homeodomain-like domain